MIDEVTIEMSKIWIIMRSVVLIIKQVDERRALGNDFQVLLDVSGELVRAKVGKSRGGICRFVTIERCRIGKINISARVVRISGWMFTRQMFEHATWAILSAIGAVAASENFVGTCLSRTIEIIEARCSETGGMPKVVVAGGAFGDGFRGWRIEAASVVHDVIGERMRSWAGGQAPRRIIYCWAHASIGNAWIGLSKK